MTETFVGFQLVVQDLLLRRDFGGVDDFAHLKDQGVNQIVVEFLVTVQNEAQQIQIHHAGRHLLQLLHGVVIHQCRVVGDTIVRDPQFGQEMMGGLVQTRQRSASGNLLFEFLRGNLWVRVSTP